MNREHWAVILAGGDGSRLQPLTRLICGDERPKQFCPIFGPSTLLAQTRARLAPAASPERTLFVVVKAHERYYEDELVGVEPSQIVVQPANKGTTAAIAYALLHLTRLDKNPIVGFFPTDHYYADNRKFTAAVKLAYDVAQGHPELLVLLGAEPEHPEVEFGWIEPSVRLGSRPGSLSRVYRFWEKPSLQVAEALLEHGCLWNTFVMIGRAKVFFDVLKSAVPGVLEALEPMTRQSGAGIETDRVADLYEKLVSGDFSHQVLSVCTDRLAVLRMGDVGWSDLGTPARILATLARVGMTPYWQRARHNVDSAKEARLKRKG